jgi:hypothetical protein
MLAAAISSIGTTKFEPPRHVEAEAVAWIARHRDRVNAKGQSDSWFRKTGRPGP